MATGNDISLREWFDHFTQVTGETPTHIVMADYASFGPTNQWKDAPVGLVEWGDVAASILDVPFDDGFGGNRSPNLCAWSPSWVIFSDNYDGSEELRWVPRHPVDHDPIRPGGG